MRYDEFEKSFPEYLRGQASGTRRVWKSRGEVPGVHVLAAQTKGSLVAPVVECAPLVAPVVTVGAAPSVTEGVTEGFVTGEAVTVPLVTVPVVTVPSAEKNHPEFDILADGWARGFPCDNAPDMDGKFSSSHIRINRTAHALRRMAERACRAEPEYETPMTKWLIQVWDHSRWKFLPKRLSDRDRVQLLKILDGYSVADAKKHGVKPEKGL